MATALAAKGLARGVKALLGLHAWNHLGLDGLFGEELDVTDLAAVAEFGKGHGQTVTPGAAGAANAVGVVLGLHRQAEVEDVGDGGHVDAASGHIGGHQNLHLPIAQRHQAAVAQPLAEGAVQGHGGKAGLLQFGGQAVALDLGAGEHDGLVDGRVAQPVVEQLALVLGVVGPEQHLFDVGMFFLRAVDLHFVHARTIVMHDTHGQLLDARRKCRTEHHGLSPLAGELVDLGQVVGEAQVQHAIGLVDHQKLDLIELDLHRALQVQQTAGGGHHQMGVLQLGDLQLVGDATDHVGNAQATAVLDQLDGVVRHLLGQFTRRAQHQRAGHGGLEVARIGRVFPSGALGRLLATGDGVCTGLVVFSLGLGFGGGLLHDQGVEYGQQKRGGFAAASLAGDHQIVVAMVRLIVGRQSQRDGARLHGGGLGVAQVGHRLDQLVRQTQLNEAIGFVGARRFGHVVQKVLRKRQLGLQVVY